MNVLPKRSILFITLSSYLLLNACADQIYQAKPLEPSQSAAKLNNKAITNTDFNAYLIKQGYEQSDLPFAQWGLNELTYCALFYQPNLALAKAQLALANAQIQTAAQKQNPSLSGNIAHSNQANNDIRPWAFGLTVEIPIETNNKRQIKMEHAQYLADAAQLDVAETAWQLRSQIAKDLLRYQQSVALADALKNALNTQTNIVEIIQKRLNLGAVSNTELSLAKLQQQKMQFALNVERAKLPEIRANLASDVGLSTEKFAAIQLAPLNIENTLTKQQAFLKDADNLQQDALLNRIDIRRSLANYAAAEAKIKLEIAQQTPDISLNPGYAFEFGDRIWSLGLSTLFNLINKNQALIAEAIQLREIEGAQFVALQAKIIGDLGQSLAVYTASNENIIDLKSQQNRQLQHNQLLQRQFDAGLIDRLEITQNQLNNDLIAQQLLNAQFDNMQAANAIENIMQKPIIDDKSHLIQSLK